MSNAPFKIAFWMMSLAFGLTILMVGLNPEEIRVALNPETPVPTINEYELAIDDGIESLDQSVLQPEVAETSITIVEAKPVFTEPSKPEEFQSNLPTPVAEEFVSVKSKKPRQIRVASADMDAPLGLPAREAEEQSILVPIPDQRFAYSDRNELTEVKRPVPDPVDVPRAYQVSLNDEIAELKGHVLRLKLAETRKEFEQLRRSQVEEDFEQVQAELKVLKQQIHDFKQSQPIVVIPEHEKVEVRQYERGEAAVSEVASEQPNTVKADPTQPVSNAIIEVTPTESENIFDFRFETAAIEDVLKTLGKYGGRTIVLGSGVTGDFTGEFKQMTPNRAFAAVIKAKQFGLSFRGDYVLVRAERDPKIR